VSVSKPLAVEHELPLPSDIVVLSRKDPQLSLFHHMGLFCDRKMLQPKQPIRASSLVDINGGFFPHTCFAMPAMIRSKSSEIASSKGKQQIAEALYLPPLEGYFLEHRQN